MSILNILPAREMDAERSREIEIELVAALDSTPPDAKPRSVRRHAAGIALVAAIAVGGAAAATATTIGLPWVNTPGALPTAPPPIPIVHGYAPTCRAGDLRVTQIGSGVMGGGTAGMTYAVQNVGVTTCHIGGYLRVLAAGRPLPHGENIMSVVPGNLRPGQSAAFAFVDSYGWAVNVGQVVHCDPTPPPVLPLTLDGKVIDHEAVRWDNCDKRFITPVGLDASGEPPIRDPLWGLTATISTPATAKIGGNLDFVVTLRNPTGQTVPLRPCPSYTVSLGKTGPYLLYRLNCTLAELGPDASQAYDVQIAVPSNVEPGPTSIFWTLDTLGARGRANVLTSVDLTR